MRATALLISTLMIVTFALPLQAIASGSDDGKCEKTETVPGCGKPRP
jgi:hypothetical protein